MVVPSYSGIQRTSRVELISITDRRSVNDKDKRECTRYFLGFISVVNAAEDDVNHDEFAKNDYKHSMVEHFFQGSSNGTNKLMGSEGSYKARHTISINNKPP
uniref:Ovule protein n=1 Tax=Angiostrongylus cantonensis TaxID=6313 RepID=A0A0K0D456_ANGCA